MAGLALVLIILFFQSFFMPLKSFLSSHNLFLVKKLSKGYSAEIFLVRNRKGKLFALKVEKQKSPRIEMARKEAEFLRLANSVGIGPRLADFDVAERCILMEFIDGARFCDWVETAKSKKVLKNFLKELFRQLRVLDALGLDHGQLGGSARNILVRKRDSKPVVVDFEKASVNRKTHNLAQFLGEFFFNKRSCIGKKMKKILGGQKKVEDFLRKLNALR